MTLKLVGFYAYVTLVLRWLCWYFVGSVGISLVALVLRWLCWYFVGSVGISLVLRWYYVGYVGVRYLTPYFGYIIFYPHVV